MIALDVSVGEAVQIGKNADAGVVVKVKHKSGTRVRLAFETNLSPIRILGDGLVPASFTYGITGEPRRVLQDVRQISAA
ncbi:hypothetical protein [Allomesorhizobium alhagi]|nr:hypothetical protein [Mesorhizobium alhagi]